MSITLTAPSAIVDGGRVSSAGISPERAFVTGGRLNKSTRTERGVADRNAWGIHASGLPKNRWDVTAAQDCTPVIS